MSNEESNKQVAEKIERLVNKVEKLSLELSETTNELRKLKQHFTKPQEGEDLNK